MCPGFDSRRHMWVEFVVGSLLCSERFFSGYSGFPLSSKTNTSKFQFDLETVDEEPPRGNATANPIIIIIIITRSLYLQDRKYVKFTSRGNLFEFTCFPNGLTFLP